MSELIFPITMGSWYRKRDRTSSNSIRCSKMESGRYAPMIRVLFPSVMTSQLTMFGSCKRAASVLHPWGQYQITRHTRPCALSSTVILVGGTTTSYSILMQQ